MIDATKLEHFRNLISLSAADGQVKEIERMTLSKIAYEHGIPMDRMNVMLSKASEYVYLIPQNTVECEQQLIQMIEFALIDGEFAKAERELIDTVGEKLGFSLADVERIVNEYTKKS
jgi:uncharacterized tellurite resistance protein B-like protein